MKYLVLALFLLFGFSVDAQNIISASETDTVTNTGADTFALASGVAYDYTYAVQARIDNISGTTDGTVVIQGQACISCSDWETIHTFTMTDALDTSFVGTSTQYYNYRSITTGSGTHSTQRSIYSLFKKK